MGASINSSDFIIEQRDFDFVQDYEGRQKVFLLCFPETAGTPTTSKEHFHWKFSEFPFKPSSFQFITRVNGELAGYYAAIPYPYRMNNQDRTCGMVCDVMTHPKMQGRGLFAKLGIHSTEVLSQRRVDFVSGYPIRPEVIPGHIKAGWFIGFQEPMYIRVIRLNSFLKSKLLFPVVLIGNFFLKGINCFFNLSLRNSKYKFQFMNREEFLKDSDYNEFFNEWAKLFNNVLVKSKDFIAWRTHAPGTEYEFLKVIHNNKNLAWAVVRKVKLRGIDTLAVLDLMTLSNDKELLRQLHKNLYQRANLNKCDAIVTMIAKVYASRYRFAQNFWLKTPAVFSIIFKVLNKNLDLLTFSNPSNWHLMWIDSDDL